MGELYLNFFLGLAEGIERAGPEMAAIFYKGAIWFCVTWFAIYCTLSAWMKSRLIGQRHVFVTNAMFSLIFINPWTLGNVAFYASLIFPSTAMFLAVWVLYFWILPMLFDALLFKALPRLRLFSRFSQKWSNPRVFIVTTLAIFIAYFPAFLAFSIGLSDALILPK